MQCTTEDCFKKAIKGRKICYTCKGKREDPIKAAYRFLKGNAKRRGKIFDLSYKYFEDLVLESGYILMRGRTPDSLSIDRIKNELGYVEGNLKIITLSENVKKGVNPEDITGIHHSNDAPPF